MTAGHAILSTFDVKSDPAWIWGGVGYLAAFFVAASILCGYVVDRMRNEGCISTARPDEAAAAASPSSAIDVDITTSHEAGVQLSSTRDSESSIAVCAEVAVTGTPTRSAVPFDPITIAWRDLHYAVTSKCEGSTTEKVLLQAVSGCAKPGRMMALMGASGAGEWRGQALLTRGDCAKCCFVRAVHLLLLQVRRRCLTSSRAARIVVRRAVRFF